MEPTRTPLENVLLEELARIRDASQRMLDDYPLALAPVPLRFRVERINRIATDALALVTPCRQCGEIGGHHVDCVASRITRVVDRLAEQTAARLENRDLSALAAAVRPYQEAGAARNAGQKDCQKAGTL